MAVSLSDWLQGRGIDEGKLTPERHAQLRNFFLHDQAEAALHPETVLDGAGQELKIGDLVTITYRVTGLHHVPDDPARGRVGQTTVNLDKVLPDGTELHSITCNSAEVKKA